MLADTARRTGIDHFILLVEGAGDRARTLANITRLGAEVLPPLRDRAITAAARSATAARAPRYSSRLTPAPAQVSGLPKAERKRPH